MIKNQVYSEEQTNQIRSSWFKSFKIISIYDFIVHLGTLLVFGDERFAHFSSSKIIVVTVISLLLYLLTIGFKYYVCYKRKSFIFTCIVLISFIYASTRNLLVNYSNFKVLFLATWYSLSAILVYVHLLLFILIHMYFGIHTFKLLLLNYSLAKASK